MAEIQHECELFSGTHSEGAESEHYWNICKKNPGHGDFISSRDFKDRYLPKIRDLKNREVMRCWLDLTVMLKIGYTGLDRPDNGDFSDHRGTNKLRVETGFIQSVNRLVLQPCPCPSCRGNGKSHYWALHVDTAHHVVFNTEESKETKVDMFYDDAESLEDGRMKKAYGVEVLRSESDRDVCSVLCVTCDDELGERLKMAHQLLFGRGNPRMPHGVLTDLGLLPSYERDCVPELIVSHPHGQPKQISVGERIRLDEDRCLKEYTTPTCPGSSGAPVLVFGNSRQLQFFIRTFHNASILVNNNTDDLSPSFYNIVSTWFKKLLGYKTRVKQINIGHYWV